MRPTEPCNAEGRRLGSQTTWLSHVGRHPACLGGALAVQGCGLENLGGQVGGTSRQGQGEMVSCFGILQKQMWGRGLSSGGLLREDTSEGAREGAGGKAAGSGAWLSTSYPGGDRADPRNLWGACEELPARGLPRLRAGLLGPPHPPVLSLPTSK